MALRVFHSRHFIKSSRFALILTLVCFAGGATTRPSQQANLALHKPAYSSSNENDEHNAARANDGNAKSSWRADDEPEGGPEWWMVDLETPVDISRCQIIWPYDGKTYRYKIEGSDDRNKWSLLSDQTSSVSRSQIQNLKFENATQVRFVKVTVTGFEEGCWASICEVRIFGQP